MTKIILLQFWANILINKYVCMLNNKVKIVLVELKNNTT